MSPRLLVRILGLCNGVAGAFLLFAPRSLASVEGIDTAAASLMARSAAVLLIAIAVGARYMPASALRPYLWAFGVGVKVAAAVVWAEAAARTSAWPLGAGAAADAAVAAVIAIGLLKRTAASN